MEIVTIMGSHRNKQNTDKSLGYLLEKIKGEHEIFNINVNKSVIEPCKACDYCLKHQGECIIKDDAMTEIYEKLKNCDLLIIASPVYFSAFPSKIKALIDRTQMLYNLKDRSIIKPKKFVVIGVGGAPYYPRQFQAVDNTLEWYKKYLKCNEIGFIQFSHTDQIKSMDNIKGLEELDVVAEKINSL
jgi:multimeric flavodoxin WrbA